jgi:PKD repeat protein
VSASPRFIPRRAILVALATVALLMGGPLPLLATHLPAAPVLTGGTDAPALSHPVAAHSQPRASLPHLASPAIPAMTWLNITPESPSTPPNLWFTEGTWDAGDDNLLFYGGDNWTGTNLATTWTYSGGSWSALNTTGNPGPLDGPALAYDPAAGRVVMYGGVASYSPFSYTNLTWTYSSGRWSSDKLNPTPPPRLAASMVYDPALGGVVLFGGYDNRNPAGGTLLNDLWLYKAGAWSQISETNPPPVRTWAPIAYDAGLGKIILYGGVNAAGQCLGDTWAFSSGSWTHENGTGTGTPGPLCANSLLYDPDLGAVLLTGGFSLNGSTQVDNLASWTFNGSAWAPLAVVGHPAEHLYGVGAYDPSTHMLVLAGGEPNFWETDVLSAPLAVEKLTGPTTVEVGESATFSANISGGAPLRVVNWSWGDGSPTNAGASATHIYTVTGTYTVAAHVRDALGSLAESNLTLLVTAGPAASITAAPTSGDAGFTEHFTGSGTGGAGTVVLSWSFGDGFSATGPTVSHIYESTGTYPVVLTATDSVGGSGMARTNLTIFPELNDHITGASVADVGWATTMHGGASGGDPTYAFLWSFDDGTNSTAVAPTHTFASPGTHNVLLYVTDRTESKAGATIEVEVAAYPTLSLSGPTRLTVGGSGSWNASVAGGYPPYSVRWTFPDGTLVNGTSAQRMFTSTGSYLLHVEAIDSLGAPVNATLNVTVAAGGGAGSSSPLGSSTLLWAGIAAAAAVAVAVGATLVIRRRRHSEPPPEE